MAKASKTRDRILDIASTSVLAKGLDATSIDEIVTEAEITKSGFFYHFRDKGALAQALIQRYIESENAMFDDLFRRARELNDDPLHTILIGLKLMAELIEDLPNGHPGCLIATVAYHERMYDRRVRELNYAALTAWRRRFRAALDDIAASYPPNDLVDLDDLADMFTGTIEGGIVLQKAMDDRTAAARQVMLLRSYIKLLFSPKLH